MQIDIPDGARRTCARRSSTPTAATRAQARGGWRCGPRPGRSPHAGRLGRAERASGLGGASPAASACDVARRPRGRSAGSRGPVPPGPTARDLPAPPPESFRDWWERTDGGRAMSARDEILGRVRAALADVGDRAVAVRPRPPACDDPVRRSVELFAERVADYRATVDPLRRGGPGRGRRGRDALAGAERVVVPAGFPVPGVRCASPTTGLSAAELDGVDAVVTGRARRHRRDRHDRPRRTARARAGGRSRLVPDLHVCVVRGRPGRRRRPRGGRARSTRPRPLTWISGPSRHQRHRARPGRGRARPPHPACPAGRLTMRAVPLSGSGRDVPRSRG